ncbi:hypothetical protein OVA14_06005 [Agrococcus sp. SL85]|uniref:hypothetical protein n=1 Tax=Agrococcus sp. SL85 TaxID=2995141 RepID=UPI00226CC210|nr:hypothetical protein [Agrococcus sp. SL85]WAC67290.1 hypothetical protein OVA14_06005 [Agrococcus sp. SL85]
MTYTPPEQPAQGGYQPAGYQPASSTPSYGYGAPASTSKKLSLWGLILGISSIVIPLFLNAIAGAVLSGIGIAKEPAAKVMAIWGLVLSILGLIWGFVFWFAVVPLVVLAALAASYSTSYSP